MLHARITTSARSKFSCCKKLKKVATCNAEFVAQQTEKICWYYYLLTFRHAYNIRAESFSSSIDYSYFSLLILRTKKRNNETKCLDDALCLQGSHYRPRPKLPKYFLFGIWIFRITVSRRVEFWRSGVRFSKVPKSFRARKAITKVSNLNLTSMQSLMPIHCFFF